MNTTTMTAPKRAFTVLHRDGTTPLVARIPEDLAIGTAVPELAEYAGYSPEPDVSTRYALLAASRQGDDYGELTLLEDGATFADVEEGSLLRVAPQPRPARQG